MIWSQPGSKLHLSLTSSVETRKTDSTLPQVRFHQTRTESPTRFYLELTSLPGCFLWRKSFYYATVLLTGDMWRKEEIFEGYKTQLMKELFAGFFACYTWPPSPDSFFSSFFSSMF